VLFRSLHSSVKGNPVSAIRLWIVSIWDRSAFVQARSRTLAATTTSGANAQKNERKGPGRRGRRDLRLISGPAAAQWSPCNRSKPKQTRNRIRFCAALPSQPADSTTGTSLTARILRNGSSTSARRTPNSADSARSDQAVDFTSLEPGAPFGTNDAT